jgi:VIT1/CCC1 family predicted Fe2+/Mn2+ transporter
MRSLYTQKSANQLQTELVTVKNVMSSTMFAYFDLVIGSLILTILMFPIHQSVSYAILIFVSFFILGISTLFLLKKWLKEQPS